MRTPNAVLALICLAASAAASAAPFDTLQPAVYFELQFGGQQPGFSAPSLDARLQYDGEERSLRPASATLPILGWRVSGEGTALSVGGVALYARSWQEHYEGEEQGTDKATKIVAGSVALTAIGAGMVVALVGAFMKSLGEGTGQALADSFANGGNDNSSGGGNTGSVCVGTICPTGSGG